MNRTLNKVAVSLIAVVAPLLALLTSLLVSGDTPDPLPSHWDLSGHVNGTASPTALLVGFVGASAVVALAEIALVWLATASAWLMPAVLCFVDWLLALSYIQILLVSRGASQASDVDLAWYSIIPVMALSVLLAVATWRLLPFDTTQPVQVTPTTVTLGRDERVVWTGSAHSRTMRVVAAVALLATGLLIFVAPNVAVPVALVAVALVATSSLGVRVDAIGLHTLWGPLGWPRTTIELADITAAHAQEIEPLKWGGWGYRVGRRGMAAVVRRGPGVVVERRGHPPYAVTVDGAPQAADVLNALLARTLSERTT